MRQVERASENSGFGAIRMPLREKQQGQRAEGIPDNQGLQKRISLQKPFDTWLTGAFAGRAPDERKLSKPTLILAFTAELQQGTFLDMYARGAILGEGEPENLEIDLGLCPSVTAQLRCSGAIGDRIRYPTEIFESDAGSLLLE